MLQLAHYNEHFDPLAKLLPKKLLKRTSYSELFRALKCPPGGRVQMPKIDPLIFFIFPHVQGKLDKLISKSKSVCRNSQTEKSYEVILICVIQKSEKKKNFAVF